MTFSGRANNSNNSHGCAARYAVSGISTIRAFNTDASLCELAMRMSYMGINMSTVRSLSDSASWCFWTCGWPVVPQWSCVCSNEHFRPGRSPFYCHKVPACTAVSLVLVMSEGCAFNTDASLCKLACIWGHFWTHGFGWSTSNVCSSVWNCRLSCPPLAVGSWKFHRRCIYDDIHCPKISEKESKICVLEAQFCAFLYTRQAKVWNVLSDPSRSAWQFILKLFKYI